MSAVLLAVALQISGTFGLQFLENYDRPGSVWLQKAPLTIWDYQVLGNIHDPRKKIQQRLWENSHIPFGWDGHKRGPDTKFILPEPPSQSEKPLQKGLFPETPSKQRSMVVDSNNIDPMAKDETNNSGDFPILIPDNDRSADDVVHTPTSVDGNGTSEVTTISEKGSSISVGKIAAVQEENIEDLDVEGQTSTRTTVVEEATETTATLKETSLEDEPIETGSISTLEEANSSTSTAETLPSSSISTRARSTTATPPVDESTSKSHSEGILSTTHIPATDNGTEAVFTTVEHVIIFPRIRTAKIIVSSVFLVIGLIAVAIIAVFIFREKRKALKYDQLNLLP